jgi:16S rRNA G966 N2-methylase RsmD
MRIAFKSYEKLVPLKNLKPNKFQRNTHPKEQIERLAKIMKTNGVRHPIHISKRSGQVCFGHGRWEAAKLNGWDKFPVVYQDFKNAKEEFTCVQSDNAIAGWAELDLKGLDGDIAQFGKDFDIELLGLKDFNFSETTKGNCDPDEIPDKAPAVCKLGDVWKLGNHRLMCGDSTSLNNINILMGGDKADMVFTDPPYQLETKGGGLFQESKAMRDISDLGIDEFDPSVLSQQSTTSVFCCNKLLIPNYIKLAEDWGVSWDIAVYHKQNITPNYGGHLMTDLEYLLVIGRQAPHTGIGEDKSLYSKLYSGGKDQDNETAWSKPVALCEKFIKLYSKRSVLDLFGGSGSTLIACEKTNRKCYMMEIDPHYCDVIIARWEKYTGNKAEKINGKTKVKAKKKI